MGERNGRWMQTYTGRQFWPLDPRPDEIHIEDIAHALSNLCRFTGHVGRFYSVAEHSVRVAEVVDDRHKLWALLHDASEAYLTDLAQPLKKSPGFAEKYLEAEDRLMQAVCRRFDLPPEMPPEVKEADVTLLVTEARDLMQPPPADWGIDVEPLPWTIHPWPPEAAKERFMEAYVGLTREEW